MKKRGGFGKIIFGGIILLAGCSGLWWNEGNYVKEDKKISEGKEVVVPGSTTKVESQNEGKLIFVNGALSTNESLIDKEFNVTKNVIKLRRKTEIYQFKEVKKDNEKEVEYKEVWREGLIDSKDYVNKKKNNPQISRFNSNKQQAEQVAVADFSLNSSLINQINAWEDLTFNNGSMIVGKDTFTVQDNVIYLSRNPQFPLIGDSRTTFSVVYPNKEVSLIAQQYNNTFAPYNTKNGRKIELLKMGKYTPEGFFQSMKKNNTNMNWALRVAGFFGLFLGFKMILSPLVALGSIVPFLGRIVGIGTSLISGLLAGGIGFIIVSISWLFYRPLIGVGLLIVGIGFLIILKKKKKVNSINNQETPSTNIVT